MLIQKMRNRDISKIEANSFEGDRFGARPKFKDRK